MMKPRNLIFILIILAIVLFGFIIYGTYKKQVAVQPMPCLKPNVTLQQHLHPTLQIIVNGVPEKMPANIGITQTCERALHTHDTSGTLHVEAQDMHAYTLGDFFRVWGTSLERNGYTLTTFVDGALYAAPARNIVLKDKQQIILSYKRLP